AMRASEYAVVQRVVRLERGVRSRRRREVVAEERVDDDIPRLRVVQPVAQRRLLEESELARDRAATLVRGVTANLDALAVGQLECDSRERRRGFGREAFAGPRGTDPVPDLEGIRPEARVQAGAAEHLGFVAAEASVHEVDAQVEVPAKRAQQLGLLLE